MMTFSSRSVPQVLPLLHTKLSPMTLERPDRPGDQEGRKTRRCKKDSRVEPRRPDKGTNTLLKITGLKIVPVGLPSHYESARCLLADKAATRVCVHQRLLNADAF